MPNKKKKSLVGWIEKKPIIQCNKDGLFGTYYDVTTRVWKTEKQVKCFYFDYTKVRITIEEVK